MKDNYKNDIEKCCNILKSGGLILYPTDTIWGIGCDATNKNAVKKIYHLKKRSDKKAMIILVESEKNIFDYVNDPAKKILEYLSKTETPTTVIYNHPKHVADNLISDEKTIAIRIVRDNFCKMLIHQFKKPIVSTSANISGETFPKNFSEISNEIKNGVDHIVQHRQNDFNLYQPSSIIKLNDDGEVVKLR